MITSSQIRSARGLLDLSQSDLTKSLGIGASTLSNIEKGKSRPSAGNAAKLQEFFEGCGVEFLDHDGVRRKPGDLLLRGAEGLHQFFDGVYESAKLGADICLFNGVPALLIEWAGAKFYAGHAKRMAALRDKFSFRIIVRENEGEFIASGFAEYRWFPEALFSKQTVYVHGDTLGLFHFSDEGLRIRVIRDGEQADTFRVMFGVCWEHVAREFE